MARWIEVIICPHLVCLASSSPQANKEVKSSAWETVGLSREVCTVKTKCPTPVSSVMPSCPLPHSHRPRPCASRHLSSPSDIMRTFTIDPLPRPCLHLTAKVLLEQETLCGFFPIDQNEWVQFTSSAPTLLFGTVFSNQAMLSSPSPNPGKVNQGPSSLQSITKTQNVSINV